MKARISWSRIWMTIAPAIVGYLMFAGSIHAAQTGVEIDSWAESQLGPEPPAIAPDGVYVNVSFPEMSTPPAGHSSGDLGADVTVAGGAFQGSYSGVNGISFLAKRGGTVDPGIMVMIMLEAANGDVYSQLLTPVESVGHAGIVTAPLDQWGACNISMQADAWRLGTKAPDETTWNAVLSDVRKLSLRFERQNRDAQSCSIGDFRLVGDGFISDAATLAAVQQHFDTNVSNVDQLSADQLAQDSDRDGTTDVDELAEGVDPGVAIEIVKVENGVVTLSYPVVKDRNYRVERSGQDKVDFNATADVVVNETSDEVGTKIVTDAPEGDGPHFYRVIKQ